MMPPYHLCLSCLTAYFIYNPVWLCGLQRLGLPHLFPHPLFSILTLTSYDTVFSTKPPAAGILHSLAEQRVETVLKRLISSL